MISITFIIACNQQLLSKVFSVIVTQCVFSLLPPYVSVIIHLKNLKFVVCARTWESVLCPSAYMKFSTVIRRMQILMCMCLFSHQMFTEHFVSSSMPGTGDIRMSNAILSHSAWKPRPGKEAEMYTASQDV